MNTPKQFEEEEYRITEKMLNEFKNKKLCFTAFIDLTGERLSQAHTQGAEEAMKKMAGERCKHEIAISGGGRTKDGAYTSWICTKCFLNMREIGIERGTTTN